MQKTVNSRNHGLVLLNPYIGPLSGATTPGLSGPGSDSNERVLYTPQSSSTTRTSPLDCLVSYPGHSFGGVPLCRGAASVFYSPSQHIDFLNSPSIN